MKTWVKLAAIGSFAVMACRVCAAVARGRTRGFSEQAPPATFAEDPAEEDIRIVKERVQEWVLSARLPRERDAEGIKELAESIRADGSWKQGRFGMELNYETRNFDSRQGGPRVHLTHMSELVRAYKDPDSEFYGDGEIKDVIIRAFDFWLGLDVRASNWWWREIGVPRRVAVILLMLESEITGTRREQGLRIVERCRFRGRMGGDRGLFAAVNAKRALILMDEDLLEKSMDVMSAGVATVKEGQGLQVDMSYHHRHDPLLTIAYGYQIPVGLADWGRMVAGTRFVYPWERIKLLIDFYLDGLVGAMAHGKYWDPGALNREISGRGRTAEPRGPSVPKVLLEISDAGYRAEELETIVAVRSGARERTDFIVNRHFWRSDYMSHQRPHYFTSVRMYSTRVRNQDGEINRQGLKNHHLSDGANFIIRSGMEYHDVFPVYDWLKIPGATVVQKRHSPGPSMPEWRDIRKRGRSDFVGGVSDGKYGAAVFDYAGAKEVDERSPFLGVEHFVACKSRFFFDDGHVCLGAGITSESSYPLATTLNQCRLYGDVIVGRGGDTVSLDEGEHVLDDVSWVWHDEVAYFFPGPEKVHLNNTEVTGNPRWISLTNPDREEKQDMFKLWLDHGVAPGDGNYAYHVVPGLDAGEVEEYRKKSPVVVLSNTPRVQAVQHMGDGLIQVVFYEAGSIAAAGGDLVLSAEKPCLAMLRVSDGKPVSLAVSDPTQTLESLELSLNVRLQGAGEGWEAQWDGEKGRSSILFALPANEYGGKSVVAVFP